MQLQDIPAVTAIEQQIQQYPWTEKLFASCLSSDYQNQVLVDGETIIGFLLLRQLPFEAEIINIGIHRKYQRQSLAKAWLKNIIQVLQQKENIEQLLLEVRQSNTAAIKLYEKIGFTQIAVREDYYPAGKQRENALIYQLNSPTKM